MFWSRGQKVSERVAVAKEPRKLTATDLLKALPKT